jgi:polyisoprenoid-binding protein YceI
MKALISSAALTLVALGTQAAPMNYSIDVPHTQIIFSVSHMGWGNSNGMLSVKSGEFTIDSTDMSKSKVDVVIDVGSLQFNHKEWNEHMAADKFFNTAKFPEMRFVSKAVKGDAKGGTIDGELTLLGVSKPVQLSFTINKLDKNPFSKKDYAGVTATGSLKRSDFGMNAYVPNVGDEVRFTINVEGSAK